MKHRQWLLSIIILICIAGWLGTQFTGEESISQATGTDLSKTDRIIFFDGSGFQKPFALTDQTKISEFRKLLERYTVIKQNKQGDSKGWKHKAVFFDGNEELCDIVFSNPLSINGINYEVVGDEKFSREITAFIESVPQGQAEKKVLEALK